MDAGRRHARGRGVTCLQPPVRRIEGQKLVVTEVGLDLEKRPESGLRRNSARIPAIGGSKAPFVTHTEHEVGRLAEVDRSDRFLASERKRFLAEDVFAGRDRLPDLLAVEGVRGREDDRVDLRIVERRLQVCGDRNPEFVTDLLGGGSVRLDRANELNLARLLFYQGDPSCGPTSRVRLTQHQPFRYLPSCTICSPRSRAGGYGMTISVVATWF